MYYPCGAGGNWLSHLIMCLDRDDHAPYLELNYHLSPRHPRVITHDHGSYHRALPEDMVIGSDCVYNFYVNFIIKWAFHDKKLNDKDYFVQVMTMQSYIGMFYEFYEFFQSMRPTLEWTDLWTNEEKFIDDLFLALQQRKMNFRRNRELAHQKIAEYKSKNVDPMLSFNNDDSLLWHGWCIGYMRYHNIPSTYKIGMPNRIQLLMAQAKKLDIAGKSKKYLFKTN